MELSREEVLSINRFSFFKRDSTLSMNFGGFDSKLKFLKMELNGYAMIYTFVNELRLLFENLYFA